jgi:hypothetical protein
MHSTTNTTSPKGPRTHIHTTESSLLGAAPQWAHIWALKLLLNHKVGALAMIGWMCGSGSC